MEGGVTELGEAECKGLGKMNLLGKCQENGLPGKCQEALLWNIPRWQRDSAVGRVQAMFLRSVAVLSICSVASLSVTATLHLPAFWEHLLLQGKVCAGKPWKQHSVLLASAIVHRSCPRGPSAEWFTSVAQKPLLFRVLLLQIVFSSVGWEKKFSTSREAEWAAWSTRLKGTASEALEARGAWHNMNAICLNSAV